MVFGSIFAPINACHMSNAPKKLKLKISIISHVVKSYAYKKKIHLT
jgi:hypothetical protein